MPSAMSKPGGTRRQFVQGLAVAAAAAPFARMAGAAQATQAPAGDASARVKRTLEEIVRESEARCERRPEAPDYMPLLAGTGEPAGWHAPPADSDIHVFDPFVPQLATLYQQARRSNIATFGYAELRTETTLLATSLILRRTSTADPSGAPFGISRFTW